MTSSSTSTQPSTSRHRFIDVVRPTRHVLTVSVSFSSTALDDIMTRTLDWLTELIKWGLTSHWTHYSSYRGRVLRVKWPNRPCQSTEGSSSPKDQASIPQGPPHHVTILHMHAICSDTQNSVFTYTKWVWDRLDVIVDERLMAYASAAVTDWFVLNRWAITCSGFFDFQYRRTGCRLSTGGAILRCKTHENRQSKICSERNGAKVRQKSRKSVLMF